MCCKKLSLQAGTPEAAKAETTRPYGRAMHLGAAREEYCVWPLAMHVVLATFLVAAKAIFWLLPLLAMLYATFQGFNQLEGNNLYFPICLLGNWATRKQAFRTTIWSMFSQGLTSCSALLHTVTGKQKLARSESVLS